jgi:aspartate 1-decarboxylase
MISTLLKCKLHRVTATQVELHYEGSCAIDGHLMDTAGLREYEQIQIYNVNNGERFTTYAIRGEEHTGMISVNGAAAHKAAVGDLLIIAAYGQYDETEAENHLPRLVYVDDKNQITHTKHCIAKQLAAV